jgi:4'-phosphopantetheinyl transferase
MTIIRIPDLFSLQDYLYCEFQDEVHRISGDFDGFVNRVPFLNPVEKDAISLNKLESGKPYLRINDENIGYSISHTRNSYVLGINRRGEIGVDIEIVGRSIHPKLMPRICSTAESWSLDTSPIQIWTIKEAVLKLTGTGLRTNMNKVTVHQLDQRNFKVHHDNKEISIVSLEMNGYWISVAWTTTN